MSNIRINLQNNDTEDSQEVSNNKRKKTLIYIAIAIVILLAIAAIFYSLSNQSTERQPNKTISDGNISSTVSPNESKPSGPVVTENIKIDFMKNPGSQDPNYKYGNYINGAAQITKLDYIDGTPTLIKDINDPNNAGYLLGVDSTGKIQNLSLNQLSEAAKNNTYTTLGIDFNRDGKLTGNEIFSTESTNLIKNLEFNSLSKLSILNTEANKVAITLSNNYTTTGDKYLEYSALGEKLKSISFLTNKEDATKYAENLNTNSNIGSVKPYLSSENTNITDQFTKQTDHLRETSAYQVYQSSMKDLQENFSTIYKKPSEQAYNYTQNSFNTGENDRIISDNTKYKLEQELYDSSRSIFKDDQLAAKYSELATDKLTSNRYTATETIMQVNKVDITSSQIKDLTANSSIGKDLTSQITRNLEEIRKIEINASQGDFSGTQQASRLQEQITSDIIKYNENYAVLTGKPISINNINVTEDLNRIIQYKQAEINATKDLNDLITSTFNQKGIQEITNITNNVEKNVLNNATSSQQQFNWVSSEQREYVNNEMIQQSKYATSPVPTLQEVNDRIEYVKNEAYYDKEYSSGNTTSASNNLNLNLSLSR